jgi:hypothetical protein
MDVSEFGKHKEKFNIYDFKSSLEQCTPENIPTFVERFLYSEEGEKELLGSIEIIIKRCAE